MNKVQVFVRKPQVNTLTRVDRDFSTIDQAQTYCETLEGASDFYIFTMHCHGRTRGITWTPITEKGPEPKPVAPVQAKAVKTPRSDKGKTRKRWTTTEDDLIHQGFEDGCSDKDIAEALGDRTAKAVNIRRTRLGLLHRAKKSRLNYSPTLN
jgi:hypothetical protein